MATLRLPDEARKLGESGALGHLVTLNPYGSPQVTCIWVGLDNDEIVSGHLNPGPPTDNPPPGQVMRMSAERVGGVRAVGDVTTVSVS